MPSRFLESFESESVCLYVRMYVYIHIFSAMWVPSWPNCHLKGRFGNSGAAVHSWHQQLLLFRQPSASLQVPCAEASAMQNLGRNTATSWLYLRKSTEPLCLIVTWAWEMRQTTVFYAGFPCLNRNVRFAGHWFLPNSHMSSPLNKIRDH